ncbi:DUF3892 domain-containing protein [Chitinophaga varians]|uniref:DUF3892 domain-containing protein n=1 Tax=Chitinophaga varians TaxID=2202339 RepID=UPI00165EF1FD|nr:DUF3892 domain-containing protein [Chitinophaga varians]MBC9911557.1 DUF3892 domain-containing protein [Chitinophaga varians]
MTRYQVTCINKRGNHYDTHERISHIGGVSNGNRWKLTEAEAIQSIEKRTNEFYVNVNGRPVDVIVALHNNRKYLKTTADGHMSNNLLNLPECP